MLQYYLIEWLQYGCHNLMLAFTIAKALYITIGCVWSFAMHMYTHIYMEADQ